MTLSITQKRVVSAFCLAAIAACSPSAPKAPQTTVVSLPAEAPSATVSPPTGPVRELFVTEAVRVPTALAIDGDLGEWLSPGSAPEGAVFLALDGKRLVLASAAREEGKADVTLALASVVPSMPDIGWVQRGGSTHELTDERCQFEQVSLPEANWENGKAQPPEAVAACRALLKRQADFIAAYRERFIRRIRLTEAGAFSLDAAGNATPIEGAKHHAGKGGIEAELPLSALPELASAPLTTLLALADKSGLPKGLAAPTEEGEYGDFLPLGLPEAIHFEPYGALRAEIFTDLEASRYVFHAELSYLASEPLTLKVVRPAGDAGLGSLGANAPDRPVVVEDKTTIFNLVEKIGDITVGLSLSHMQMLVVYKGDTMVSTIGSSDIRGIKAKDGDIHVFTYSEGGFTWAVGTYIPPSWSVNAIKKDGTIESVCDEGVDSIGDWNAWDDAPTPFSDPDFKSFGMRGKRGKKEKTVLWRWDDATKNYVSIVIPKSQAGGSP